MAGFSDHNRHFVTTAYALVSNENSRCYTKFFTSLSQLGCKPNVLMADADAAITKAAKKVWPTIHRTMCYYHMKKNVRDTLVELKVPTTVQNAIHLEIEELQTIVYGEKLFLSGIIEVVSIFWIYTVFSCKTSERRMGTSLLTNAERSPICGVFL